MINSYLNIFTRGKYLPFTVLFIVIIWSSIAYSQPSPIGNEFQINTYTTNSQADPKIAVDNSGNFVVVWVSNAQDDGCCINDNGIYGQRFDRNGNTLGVEFLVNSFVTGNQFNPSVAMDDDGDFVVVWESWNQNNGNTGIYGQRYDKNGIRQGSEFLVNTSASSKFDPDVAMDSDGNFVVVWTTVEIYNGFNTISLYGRRFSSNGSPLGAEFLIDIGDDNQDNPSVSMASNGDFVVVWNRYELFNTERGIFGKRYNSNGVAQGSVFQIDTYITSQKKREPNVDMNSNGEFVVVWHTYNKDGDGFSVNGRRFDNNGTAQGTEFSINTYTISDQENPSIAIDSDGNFMVTWGSRLQDNGTFGVYGQYYDSNGIAQGTESLINTYSPNSQASPAVAMDGNGNFTVVWFSFEQDGDFGGVYGQQYSFGSSSCPVDEHVSGTILGANRIASNKITSNATLLAGVPATFQAGSCIILQAGFEAQLGVDFHAYIAPCISSLKENSNNNFVNKILVNTTIDSPTNLFLQASPNPFSIATTIDYQLPSDGPVNLYLTNAYGQRVQTIATQQYHAKGAHQLQLQTNTSPKGLYFLVLEQGAYQETQKLYLN